MMHELFDIIKIVSEDTDRGFIKSLFTKYKINRIRNSLHKFININNLSYSMMVDFIEFYTFSSDYIGTFITKDVPIRLIRGLNDNINYTIIGNNIRISFKAGDPKWKTSICLLEENNNLQTVMYGEFNIDTIKTLIFKVIAKESFNRLKSDMIATIDHIVDMFIKRV